MDRRGSNFGRRGGNGGNGGNGGDNGGMGGNGYNGSNWQNREPGYGNDRGQYQFQGQSGGNGFNSGPNYQGYGDQRREQYDDRGRNRDDFGRYNPPPRRFANDGPREFGDTDFDRARRQDDINRRENLGRNFGNDQQGRQYQPQGNVNPGPIRNREPPRRRMNNDGNAGNTGNGSKRRRSVSNGAPTKRRRLPTGLVAIPRSDPRTRCGWCKKQGHVRKDCCSKVDDYGYIRGCVRCDSDDHEFDICPAKKYDNDDWYYLVKCRHNRPPVYTKHDLRDIMAQDPDDNYHPFTPEFSLELDSTDYYRNFQYGPRVGDDQLIPDDAWNHADELGPGRFIHPLHPVASVERNRMGVPAPTAEDHKIYGYYPPNTVDDIEMEERPGTPISPASNRPTNDDVRVAAARQAQAEAEAARLAAAALQAEAEAEVARLDAIARQAKADAEVARLAVIARRAEAEAEVARAAAQNVDRAAP